MGEVSISLANGQIGGKIATTEGVVGHIGTGTGAGTLALLTPILVVSLADAISKGVTLADEPIMYDFVKTFYDVEGTFGRELYLMIAANTVSLETLADKTNASGAKKLLAFGAGKIRVLSISRTPAGDYVPATVQFIDSDAIASLPKAKLLQQEQFTAKRPVRILIEARVHDNTHATIFEPKAQNNNAAALILGGTTNNGQAAMALVLAMVSAVPSHRSVARVKNGQLPVDQLYIGNKKLEEFTGLSTLITAGYITFKKFEQTAGYFISGDPMCTAVTDDYASLTRCRVIDKASIITYQTYVQEINDDVELESDGTLDPIILANLEAKIENNIGLSMSENISGDARAYIDPEQNFATGSQLKVKLRATPKGHLRDIDVELGYEITEN